MEIVGCCSSNPAHIACITFWTNAQYLKIDFMHNLDDDGVPCMHKNDDHEEPKTEIINGFESLNKNWIHFSFSKARLQ